jgi:hypothetical protein
LPWQSPGNPNTEEGKAYAFLGSAAGGSKPHERTLMKTITIDFDTYESELAQARHKGYRDAMNHARRIVDEFNAGKSEDRMITDHCEEQFEVDFVYGLFHGGNK